MPKSEIFTRFDRILEVEENESHVKLTLEFFDNLINDNYHKLIEKVFESKTPNRKIVSGIVTRIIPIGDISLEIIQRDERIHKPK